jgi:hypothetical protein
MKVTSVWMASMLAACTTSPVPSPVAPAGAARPGVVMCKPCGDPIETALMQAGAIVLGQPTSRLEPEPVPQQAGRASLGFRVKEWLRKPQKSASGGKLAGNIQVDFSWDGACKPPPPPVAPGVDLVLFLSWQGDRWLAVPGACAQAVLDPVRGEVDLKMLRKLAPSSVHDQHK